MTAALLRNEDCTNAPRILSSLTANLLIPQMPQKQILLTIAQYNTNFRSNTFDISTDAYFPNLDEKPEWKITAESEEQTYFDLEFYFYKYERVQK